MRYSAINCYKNCPRQYRFQYVDKVEVDIKLRANDARIVGTAVHLMFEEDDIQEAIEYYKSNYGRLFSSHYSEISKFNQLYPKIESFKKKLVDPEHEIKWRLDDWEGTIDLIDVDKMYDFKYSNNIDNYLDSAQLHIYTYFIRKLGFEINNMYYVFVPKTFIRQKKNETPADFKERLKGELKDKQLEIREIKYNEDKVNECFEIKKKIETTEGYPKNITKLCDWCDYKELCRTEED